MFAGGGAAGDGAACAAASAEVVLEMQGGSTWEDNSTRVIVVFGLFVLGVGTVVYRILEDWSWVDSFYFSAVALTTVGFGDLAPSTDAAKLFTVFYIFSGVSLIGALLNEFMKRHAQRLNARTARHHQGDSDT